MDAPTAYKISEIISISGLGRTSVFRAIKTGKLKARKFGRRTLVLKDDLETFIGSLPSVGNEQG